MKATRTPRSIAITLTLALPTDADRQQFRDSILTKYGQPYREVKAVAALWCNKGTSLGSARSLVRPMCLPFSSRQRTYPGGQRAVPPGTRHLEHKDYRRSTHLDTQPLRLLYLLA